MPRLPRGRVSRTAVLRCNFECRMHYDHPLSRVLFGTVSPAAGGRDDIVESYLGMTHDSYLVSNGLAYIYMRLHPASPVHPQVHLKQQSYR